MDQGYSGAIQETANYRMTLGFANNQYSSLWNRNAYTARFHEDSHCGGKQLAMTSGTWKYNLNNNWWFDWNDEIGSVYRDGLNSNPC